MSSHTPEEIRAHVSVYLKVFGALAVLTVVTVAVSYLDLGGSGNIAVALIIALFKAGLVATFFMHLKGEVSSIFRTLILTGLFFVVLMVLPLSHFADHTGDPNPETLVVHEDAGEHH
jgi:cytochrome c oxidase subunit 4